MIVLSLFTVVFVCVSGILVAETKRNSKQIGQTFLELVQKAGKLDNTADTQSFDTVPRPIKEFYEAAKEEIDDSHENEKAFVKFYSPRKQGHGLAFNLSNIISDDKNFRVHLIVSAEIVHNDDIEIEGYHNTSGKYDLGKWALYDLTELVKERVLSGHTTMQVVVARKENGRDPMGSESVALACHNWGSTKFLEMLRVRRKRSGPTRDNSQENTPGVNSEYCHREPYYVNFNEIGWNMVIAPQGFNAYVCRGSCQRDGENANQRALENAFNGSSQRNMFLYDICCGARSFSSLTILYLDTDSALHIRNLPNMVARECICM